MSDYGWTPATDQNGEPCVAYTGSAQTFPPQELGGETQATIGQWARETFPGGDDDSPVHALRALQEMIELCQACGASCEDMDDVMSDFLHGNGEEYRVRRPDPAAVAGEIADVAITLNVLAERRKIDLMRQVRIKMVRNRSRRWRSNGDGTGQHIPDDEPRKDGE